jgi:hypothetical protein
MQKKKRIIYQVDLTMMPEVNKKLIKKAHENYRLVVDYIRLLIKKDVEK